jgi:hypothetical protein
MLHFMSVFFIGYFFYYVFLKIQLLAHTLGFAGLVRSPGGPISIQIINLLFGKEHAMIIEDSSCICVIKAFQHQKMVKPPPARFPPLSLAVNLRLCFFLLLL